MYIIMQSTYVVIIVAVTLTITILIVLSLGGKTGPAIDSQSASEHEQGGYENEFKDDETSKDGTYENESKDDETSKDGTYDKYRTLNVLRITTLTN